MPLSDWYMKSNANRKAKKGTVGKLAKLAVLSLKRELEGDTISEIMDNTRKINAINTDGYTVTAQGTCFLFKYQKTTNTIPHPIIK
jgi:hypothetical protein